MSNQTTENPYRQSIDMLTEAFKFFNQKLENGRLTTPIITILPRGKKKALGWFWSGKWNVDGKPVSEISISAETLNRSVDEVLETLIHEIAHYANDVDGVVDARNNYHNKNFKKKAESYGLTVTKYGAYGYGVTALGDKAKTLIEEFKKDRNVSGLNMQRKVAASVYIAKNFYVPVEEETKTDIREYAAQEGMSEKEFVAYILRRYVNDTQSDA